MQRKVVHFWMDVCSSLLQFPWDVEVMSVTCRYLEKRKEASQYLGLFLCQYARKDTRSPS